MKKNIIRPLLVIIFPYKFTEFQYTMLEIKYFHKYCDIEIWDLSLLLDKKWAMAINTDFSEQKELIRIKHINHFYQKIKCLNHISKRKKICIYNNLYNNTAKQFICSFIIYLHLKNANIIMFKEALGGVPILQKEKSNVKKEFFSFKQLRRKIKNKIFLTISKKIPQLTTHVLVAGDHYKSQIINHYFKTKNKIKIIEGHSEDYSNFLIHRYNIINTSSKKKRAVHLDAPSPACLGDDYYIGKRLGLTCDKWYPALTCFFDRIEKETNVHIDISGHYKSAGINLSSLFGNRNVYYQKSRELVKNSEFVITRSSTAISYAVIYRKPVIFIYSNQLKNSFLMRDIYGMANLLGTTPVNIENPNIKIDEILQVNEDCYKKYENICLTSAHSKGPNYNIILQEIMNVSV